jgi:hypothetical protein
MANGDLAVVEALRLLSHKTLVSFADLPKIQMLALLKSQKREVLETVRKAVPVPSLFLS